MRNLRFIRSAAFAAVILITALALALRGGATHVASAEPHYSAMDQPVVEASAASDPALQQLQRHNPKLNLDSARVVLSDASGTVWLTTATDGDICLVERVGDSSFIASRFSCRHADDVATQGIIGGVPGHFYGAVPDDINKVSAHVGARDVALTVSRNAFRVPPDAASVKVGNAAPAKLPRP